ncbi:MAG: 2Fe-2S iron-sulfur cluster binding domain-containing protein [Bacteroidetes bacterium]|nr:2Fe-2S iron-sulfur cluster binding domain-containing protein [Bacteroidota bacterium]
MTFTIHINGQAVQVKKGEALLSVIRERGILLPTLCHMEGFIPSGACRLCVVEVKGTDELVPACSSQVAEWMEVYTHSPKVITARKAIVELLIANHPDDCLYCERNGTCELQDLAGSLGLSERKFAPHRALAPVDRSCPSILRDPSKCVLCGRCIRICNEVQVVGSIEFVGKGNQTAIGTALNQGFNLNTCVKCGQCIKVCPTAALTEYSHIPRVQEMLQQPDHFAVATISPAVSSSPAEALGLKPPKDAFHFTAQILKTMGFKEVFDTSFASDIKTLLDARELAKRIKEKKQLPAFTGCCPSWTKYLADTYPDHAENLFHSGSPQQIMGSLIRNFYRKGPDAQSKEPFILSIEPCTARKYEATQYTADEKVDAVITTRELVRLIRYYGIDVSLPVLPTAPPLNRRSSASKLSVVSGGVTESVIRSLYPELGQKEPAEIKCQECRGQKPRRDFRFSIGKQELGVAIVSGLNQARKLMDEIVAGRDDLHLVEVMACPGGCIYGGGQPMYEQEKTIRNRIKALYDLDAEEPIKTAHRNPGAPDVLSLFESIN